MIGPFVPGAGFVARKVRALSVALRCAPGVSEMKRLGLVIVAAAMALVFVAWWALGRFANDKAAAVTSIESASSDVDPKLLAIPQAAEPGRVETATSVAANASDAAPTTVSEVPANEAELAELRGRFLFPDGSPAQGVALNFRGWQGNQERALKFGAPENWTDIDGASDADGRFSMRFDPPRAFQFVLDANLDAHARLAWRWGELPQRAVTDIGDVSLVRAGSIRGRIVDKSGKPVPGKWNVNGDSNYRTAGPGGDESRAFAKADPLTAAFLLEALPPGPVELKAYSRITNWVDGPTVDVRAGEETVADIVYDGPDNSRRITVTVFTERFYVFHDPAPGSLVLHGPGGERAATKVPHSSQSWSFEDVDPGVYTIELRDPRFEPWSKSGIAPGETLDAKIRGSAGVALAVSGPDGALIDEYRLRLRFRNVSMMPNEFELRAAHAAAPPGCVYSGLVPSDFTLIVEAPGFGIARVDVDALRANEVRSVNVALAPGSTIRGHVSGLPAELLEHVSIMLAPAELGSDAAHEFEDELWSSSTDVTTTELDHDGRFRFEGLVSGRFNVIVRVHAGLRLESGLFELAAGATREVELTLPPTAAIVGNLLAPQGFDFTRAWIEARTVSEEVDEWSIFDGPQPLRVRVAQDGTFRVGTLPSGSYRVLLTLSESSLDVPSKDWRGTPTVLGEARVAPPSDTTVRFDIAQFVPGSADVRVTVGGAPAVGLLINGFGTRPGERQSSWLDEQPTDSDGRVKFSALIPGEWEFVAHASDGSWSVNSTKTSIAAGADVRVAIDVVLYEGTLVVLDAATGKPVARERIDLSADGSDADSSTDGDGRLALRLPVGRYSVARSGNATEVLFPGPQLEVEWTASGPVPREIRLEPGIAPQRDH